jgi:hypothetical protein
MQHKCCRHGTPHDLRHTAAGLAVSAGANAKAVQRMLGHAKTSMTLDVYANLFDDDLDVVAGRLDAAIVKTGAALTPAKPFLRPRRNLLGILRTGAASSGSKNRP